MFAEVRGSGGEWSPPRGLSLWRAATEGSEQVSSCLGFYFDLIPFILYSPLVSHQIHGPGATAEELPVAARDPSAAGANRPATVSRSDGRGGGGEAGAHEWNWDEWKGGEVVERF